MSESVVISSRNVKFCPMCGELKSRVTYGSMCEKKEGEIKQSGKAWNPEEKEPEAQMEKFKK